MQQSVSEEQLGEHLGGFVANLKTYMEKDT